MARALASGPGVEILTAPGNPGTAALGTNLDLPADDVPALVATARDHRVELVVPGPEGPLVAGLADALVAAGIRCAGPGRAAARLEASKAFTRQVAAEAGVRSPVHRLVSDPAEIEAALAGFADPPVVKADGLAAGKGVMLPDDFDECRRLGRELLGGGLGEAGRRIVLEERLFGIEASLFYACRGTAFVALPHARDHKRLLEGDQGPNTGGMGAVSPNPAVGTDLERQVADEIIRPVLRVMVDRGTPFHGFLFAGLMLTTSGPALLEFNVRLGDPEAQAILPRIEQGRFLEVCSWVAGQGEDPPHFGIDPDPTCAVVLAAAGYPESPRRGDPIEIDPAVERPDRWFIHAGTAAGGGGLITAGGRVGAVVARGGDATTARRLAYEGVRLVRWEGMTYRRDVGAEVNGG